MLGITEEELDTYFGGYIEAFSENRGISEEDIKERLKEYYNGYRFSKKDDRVYKPFSLLNCFENKEFDNYWSETGVPYYLANMLKKKNFYLPELEGGTEFSKMDLASFELERIEPVAVLFQAGFLTIKEIIDEFMYLLSFPNKEVKTTFNSLMLKVYGR